MDELIRFCNVEYTYPDGTNAINGINLTIKKGEKIALMGENGSGKSTLFKLLNGTIKPTKGEILIDGEPINYNKKGLLKVRKKIGIVFQDADDQLFSTDVRQDISFGLFNLGFDEKTVKEKVNKIIDYFNMACFAKKPVQFLSGGEKKRVAVSDVVVMEPEIILFDEPSSGMDPKNMEILDDIINELSKKGITLVISTHDCNKVFENAKRVVVMKNGKIIDDAQPIDVFSNEKILKEAQLKKPFVLDIYEFLKEKNIINEKLNEIPYNIEQLKYIIKG